MISETLMYWGSAETLPNTGENGWAVFCDGITYVYYSGEWIPLDGGAEEHSTNEHPANCKNCGAVLTSNKCEFCGTEY